MCFDDGEICLDLAVQDQIIKELVLTSTSVQDHQYPVISSPTSNSVSVYMTLGSNIEATCP